MKYAVIQCVNGNFTVSSEHGENLDGAEIAFANLWAALVNETQAVDATIKVVNEKFDTVNGDVKRIQHAAKA